MLKRTQYVDCMDNGIWSSIKEIETSESQGAIQDPILVLYMNDINIVNDNWYHIICTDMVNKYSHPLLPLVF